MGLQAWSLGSSSGLLGEPGFGKMPEVGTILKHECSERTSFSTQILVPAKNREFMISVNEKKERLCENKNLHGCN